MAGSPLAIHCVLDRVKHRGARDKVGGLDKGQGHKQEVVDKLCIFSYNSLQTLQIQYIDQVSV